MTEMPPQQGREPTPDEEFYLAWGKETFKGNITRLNELQKNLMTLSISLLGGGIIFYNDAFVDPLMKRLALVVLLVAAVISMLGSAPEDERVDLASPGAIRAFKQQTLQRKRCWYYASYITILAGLGLALLGIFLKSE